MAKEIAHSKAFTGTYNPQNRAAQGLSHVLSRADSILLDRKVRVKVLTEDAGYFHARVVNDASQTIGHSEGDGYRVVNPTIILPDMNKGKSSDPVVTTLGYNYHAIAHRKFSPSPMMLRSAHWDLKPAEKHFPTISVSMDFSASSRNVYHMFECARAERLMISAFPSTRSYFASATYNKVSTILSLNNMGAPVSGEARLLGAYLYLALRPYLAKPVRMRGLEELHRMVSYRIDDDAVTQAVSEYLNLTYPGARTSRSYVWPVQATNNALARLFDALPHDEVLAMHLSEIVGEGLTALCDNNMSREDNPPSSSQEQQEALQKVAQEKQDGDGDDDSSDGEEGSEGEGEGEGDAEGEGSEGDGEADGEGESQGQGQGGSEAGSGPGNNPQSFEDSIEQEADKASGEAMENESSRREVENIRQSMSVGGSFSPYLEGILQRPDADYVLMQKQMSREFGKIMEDADPGFLTHQASGRVSMKRAMHGIDDYDSAFDVWDEGKLSASSMEVVLLLDNSGSMNSSIKALCQSAWAIARGIESLGDNAKVTSIFFNSDSFISKRAVEKETAQYTFHGANGGTDPTTGLVDAARILTESSRAHRLCIILTDGSWHGTNAKEPAYDRFDGSPIGGVSDAEIVIAQMQKKGVHVSLAGMFGADIFGHTSSRIETHGADVYKTITQPKDFIDFARNIVKEAMMK